MNLFMLSYSYLRKRALNTFLNVLLLSFGIATVVILLLFSYQLEDNLYKNADEIDVVVGAKGSPIQLILSSIYHIDSPTGNIELAEAKELMNHQFVADSTPLALGDNYQGYRIVGTTTHYLQKYRTVLAEGTLWDHKFEVVLGASVAENENLAIGDEIVSSHGFSEAGHTHDDHNLRIVGILEPTGKVVDRLILTGVETMWGIHEVHTHEDEEENEHHHHAVISDHHHTEDNHGEHSHTHHSNEDNHSHSESGSYQYHADPISLQTDGREVTDQSYLFDEYNDEQITSMLISYQNPLAAAQFSRFVNEQTSMQAAAPSYEITRLLTLLGVGLDTIRWFAYLLIFASVLGIFIALLNSMKERKYDLAIMRTLGGTRAKLFTHILFEGMMIAVAGGLLGILLGHLAVEVIGRMFAEAQQFAVTGYIFIPGEGMILVLVLVVGMISAILPAVLAYNTDIAQTLVKT